MEGGTPPQPPGMDMTVAQHVPLGSQPRLRLLRPLPFDWTCNNEQLRIRSLHPLDLSQLTKMTGTTEFVLCEVMEPPSWMGRALYYIQKAFTTAASKLEKIGYDGSVDSENETALLESKVAKVTIDLKEVKRVDNIPASLQHKRLKCGFVTVDYELNSWDLRV
ncbi:mediator of RNA polymerase II transcription subunit 6-like [Lotus japonicus]|uniref:mediator of RNA polymerase II transcription subunit 6-like n=1 Tax=Lotus japonicus TaxID=34305 RepID=UPI00258B14C5|nr:mediator of RNA polymerase II transcription subunit 6-like [Lotus japonicus]